MKRLASTMPNMILSLTIVTSLAGALLGSMYAITKKPIEQQQAMQRVAAVKDVAPPFNNDPLSQSCSINENGADFTVYPAFLDGKFNGAAVQGSTMNGFSGLITIMCGFNADGTVRDYRVLEQAETPGLGAKMEMWFRDPAGARSIISKSPAQTPFYVSKDPGGSIDGITAATISSRAFLETIRAAYMAYRTLAESNGINLKSVTAAGNSSESEGTSGASHSYHNHEKK